MSVKIGAVFSDVDVGLEQHELDSLVLENFHEIKMALEEQTKLLDVVVALENMSDCIKKDQKYTMSPQLAVATEMMFAGDSSLGGYNLVNISLEELSKNRQQLLDVLSLGYKQLGQKFIDHFHYMGHLFTLQNARVAKLRKLVSELKDSDSCTISVNKTKYMCYGDNYTPVSDFKEYLARFKSLTKTMVPFVQACDLLSKSTMFSKVKLVFSLLTLQPSKFVVETFASILESCNKIKSATGMRLEINKPNFKTYASEVMLGGSQAVVTVVPENNYDKDDHDSIGLVYKLFYFYLYRNDKIKFSTPLAGSLDLTVTGKELKELLEEADDLLKEVSKLMSIGNKVSNLFLSVPFLPITNIQTNGRNPERSDYDQSLNFAGNLRTIRIYNRTVSIMFDSVSSGFNFSMGNIKKSLSVIESSVKKLS